MPHVSPCTPNDTKSWFGLAGPVVMVNAGATKASWLPVLIHSPGSPSRKSPLVVFAACTTRLAGSPSKATAMTTQIARTTARAMGTPPGRC
jgi:hypothetical protein